MVSTLDLITIVAACFAALYTRQVVKEAKKQNDVARLEKLLGIYHSLNNFKKAIKEIIPDYSFPLTFRRIDPKYPENALLEFEIAAQLSEFYFSRNIFNEFERISKVAFANREIYNRQLKSNSIKHADLLRNVPGNQNPSENQLSLVRKSNKKLLNDCIALSENVRLYIANLAGSVS